MVPTRHHQDAVHLPLFGKGANLLTVFPCAGRGQQMNGLSGHPMLNGKSGGGLSIGAGVPKFGGQTLPVQGDAMQDAFGTITADDDNGINPTDARRLGEPVPNPGKRQSGRSK